MIISVKNPNCSYDSCFFSFRFFPFVPLSMSKVMSWMTVVDKDCNQRTSVQMSQFTTAFASHLTYCKYIALKK